MGDAVLIHRLQFGFTISYHYLFPQLTLGLGPLIVVLKTLALKTNDERYDKAARFWAKIFAINFVIGVVTGIPMEFQFGTNWSHFSRLAGGVIGQTLAMESMFAFFLESSFLGLFLYGEKRLSKVQHGWPLCWSGLAHGCRVSSSSPPTHGCSTRSATSAPPTARSN
jgi:cytochrome d ubiquinol oxidase subunit I